MCSACDPQLRAKVDRLNALFLEVQAYKRAHPEARTGYDTGSAGSLLNAYREGDISFDECIALMAKIYTGVEV